MVQGKRADLGVIKDPTRKCIVDITFQVSAYGLKKFFEENDLDYEDETHIRREILPSGKSRAFVNDTPVTLDVLRGLGAVLLDVHSQHDTLLMRTDTFQYKILDAYSNAGPDRVKYAAQLQLVRKLEKALAQLVDSQAASTKELDYNTFLFEELDAAALKPDELNEVERKQQELGNVDTIGAALGQSNQSLTADTTGLLDQLRSNLHELSKIKDLSPRYQDVYERMNSMLLEGDDLASTIVDLEEDLELDPVALEQIEERLGLLKRLMQKHQVADYNELLDIRDQLSQVLDDTNSLDTRIQAAREELSKAQKRLKTLGTVLFHIRRKSIPQLQTELQNRITRLGMPDGTFEVELVQGDRFRESGNDELQFLFSANKGMPLKPLDKAASGGELSRIMMVIKTILAEYSEMPTLIFDEIDTGVSGNIAGQMAAMMQEMAQRMQLISITHLPQIAAAGASHFKVYKDSASGVATTDIRPLELEERVEEIAGMISGGHVTSSAQEHARTLLANQRMQLL